MRAGRQGRPDRLQDQRHARRRAAGGLFAAASHLRSGCPSRPARRRTRRGLRPVRHAPRTHVRRRLRRRAGRAADTGSVEPDRGRRLQPGTAACAAAMQALRISEDLSRGPKGLVMQEKYFERREIKDAIAFAEAGEIAVHRNFDSYHGSTIRGFRREKPFLHVIGLRPELERWGKLHGLRPEWIQPEKRRKVAHYDVFGPAAEELIRRLKPALDRV